MLHFKYNLNINWIINYYPINWFAFGGGEKMPEVDRTLKDGLSCFNCLLAPGPHRLENKRLMTHMAPVVWRWARVTQRNEEHMRSHKRFVACPHAAHCLHCLHPFKKTYTVHGGVPHSWHYHPQNTMNDIRMTFMPTRPLVKTIYLAWRRSGSTPKGAKTILTNKRDPGWE